MFVWCRFWPRHSGVPFPARVTHVADSIGALSRLVTWPWRGPWSWRAQARLRRGPIPCPVSASCAAGGRSVLVACACVSLTGCVRHEALGLGGVLQGVWFCDRAGSLSAASSVIQQSFRTFRSKSLGTSWENCYSSQLDRFNEHPTRSSPILSFP